MCVPPRRLLLLWLHTRVRGVLCVWEFVCVCESVSVRLYFFLCKRKCDSVSVCACLCMWNELSRYLFFFLLQACVVLAFLACCLLVPRAHAHSFSFTVSFSHAHVLSLVLTIVPSPLPIAPVSLPPLSLCSLSLPTLCACVHVSLSLYTLYLLHTRLILQFQMCTHI